MFGEDEDFYEKRTRERFSVLFKNLPKDRPLVGSGSFFKKIKIF